MTTLKQTITATAHKESKEINIRFYKEFACEVIKAKCKCYMELIQKEMTEGLTHLDQRDKRNIEEFFLLGAFHGMPECENVDWELGLQTLRLRAKQQLEADLKEQKEKEKEEQAKSASAKTTKGKALALAA